MFIIVKIKKKDEKDHISLVMHVSVSALTFNCIASPDDRDDAFFPSLFELS